MTVLRRIVGLWTIQEFLVAIAAALAFVIIFTLIGGYRDFRETELQLLADTSVIAEHATALNRDLGVAVLTPGNVSTQGMQDDIMKMREALVDMSQLGQRKGQTEILAAAGSAETALGRYESAFAETIRLAKADEQVAQAEYETLLGLAEDLNESVAAVAKATLSRSDERVSGLNGRAMTMLFVATGIIAVAFVIGIAFALLTARSIGRDLRQASASISASSELMLSVAVEMASGVSQTVAATSETTATVEEVKQTVLLAADKANEVASDSQDVARVAESGLQAVEDTIVGIGRIEAQMCTVTDTIHTLTERTRAVEDIMSAVNDLAEQSKLLSVNASIEAAKAGEHGRGFNVVAQEVKGLAEQSRQAVAQVRTILTEIQKAGALAASAAEHGQTAIQDGHRQARESGESIQRLAESVSQSARSAVQIASSSRQQLAGMVQIAQAIESIDRAGADSAKGTQQVESEVKRLQELALALKRLVEARATG